MPTHQEMYLAVQAPLLSVLKADPSLRPSYCTAVQYWLAPTDLKIAYRPTRNSRYQALLKATIKVASVQEKSYLAEINSLGDSFTPLSS